MRKLLFILFMFPAFCFAQAGGVTNWVITPGLSGTGYNFPVKTYITHADGTRHTVITKDSANILFLPLSGGALTGSLTGTAANFSSQVGGYTFVSSSYGGTLIAGDASFGNVIASAINTGPFIGLTTKRNSVNDFRAGSNAGGTHFTQDYWNGSAWTPMYTVNSSGAAFTVPVTATSFIGNASTATTATNSTQWNAYTFDKSTTYSTGFDLIFGRTAGTDQARLIDANGLKTYLGLGSNAYTSTAYTPLVVATPVNATDATPKSYVDGLIPAVTNVTSAALTAVGTILSYPVASDGTFTIGGFINISSITLGSSTGIRYRISYTDLNGVGQAVDFFPPGATSSTLGSNIDYPFPPYTLRVQGGTSIVILTQNVTAVPTAISYKAGVLITKY